MSKASEQMDGMSIDDIHRNPCGFCWACDWEKKHDCHKVNPAQCSVCSVILRVIEKSKAEHEDVSR